MLGQPVTIYEVVREPTAQTTITDVLFGTVSVVLALAAVAVLLGLLWAGTLIAIRRTRRKNDAEDSGDADVTRLGLNSRP